MKLNKLLCIMCITLCLFITSCVFAANNNTTTGSTPSLVKKKMITGKRIIINSVVGYAAIQLLDLIIKFIEAVIK